MIRCLSIFVVLQCCLFKAISCTTFFIHHNGQMVFGRNYDWFADAGIVCTNQRGLNKTSMPVKDGKSVSWQSKYGSISFNQYGKEFPTGGMNEKGLVVELMWLDGTQYPKPDERASIGVLQWIQYQLDNCSNVEEVIATDKTLRIVSEGVPLHYLVADATGQTATIEFLDGKMVSHQGKSLPQPVLTNNTYSASLAGFNQGKTNGNNSLERFATACRMVTEIKADRNNASLVDRSFAVLDRVAQGDFTKWSIVYDVTAKMIYFKTRENDKVRSVKFSDFDFTCSKPSRVLDINHAGDGNMDNYFTDFSPSVNKVILEKSLKQSRPQIEVNDEQKQATLAYPGAISCK